jgi:competence protein ComEC
MLIRLAVAWMLGIVAADLLRPPPPWLAAGAAIFLIVALCARRSPGPRLVALCLLCTALGALRYSAALPALGPGAVSELADRGEVRLAGSVAADPRRADDGQRVVLQVEVAAIDGVHQAVDGLVLVLLPPYPAYRYGDRLELRGELQLPRGAERPGEFDYRAYLAHRGIFVLMREPEGAHLLAGRSGLAPLASLLRFREHCRAIMLRTLPEPQAALAVGILLGIQSSIPEEVYSAFSITGTSHILVVSGWNFTIVASVIGAAAARLRLGRWQTFLVALAVMWIYALLTGASAAVLRAAAMASLAAVARATERNSEPWRLLLAACWLISLADPHTLWDLGFQLSALATGSLFAFARPVETWLGQRQPFSWPAMAPITEALTATLAAQVLTLPLIVYQFGNLSLIAPLANIIVVPVVPVAMALCTVALLGGLIWLPLGQWLALAAWLPLTWLAESVRLLATPRLAAVQIPPFPIWWLLGFYAVVAWLWWRGQRGATEPAALLHGEPAA